MRDAASRGYFQFGTANAGDGLRWRLGISDDAESGANAGSNLNIESFDDSGNHLGWIVNISASPARSGTAQAFSTRSARELELRREPVGLHDHDGRERRPAHRDAARSLDLPRQVFNIKKIDSSTNAVRITGNGAETVDGANTQDITTQWASAAVQSNGTSWVILNGKLSARQHHQRRQH